jgi:hypothetical protein
MSKKYKELDDSIERIREKYIQFDIQLKNKFLTRMHDVFIKRFGKAQRYYFRLSRLARLWKVKRSPVRICTDLCGNNLVPTTTNCMVIYQNNSLYYFSVSDLINIYKNALMHASYLFVISPICPKNPYTNVAFSKAILYAIYWKIRRSDYNLPLLLQLYYNSFFDETILLYKHEPIIRELYMNDMLKMSDEKVLEPYVKIMLKEFIFIAPFQFDPEFPPKKLLEIMYPYLRLYFIHRYSILCSDEKYQACFIIKHKLKKLYEFNPILGRKIYKKKKILSLYKRKTRPVYIKSFQDTYIKFHDILMESSAFDTESEDTESEDTESEDTESEDTESEDETTNDEYDDDEDEIDSNNSV